MTFTLRESSSAVAAPPHTSVPASDPWDAPYFGGRVYFSYHPTLYATLDTPPAPPLPSTAIAGAAPTAPSASEPAQAQAPSHRPAPLGLDPWDAPYFGGPVYFRYPAFPVAGATLATPAALLDAMPAASSALPIRTPASNSPAPSELSDSPAVHEIAGPPAATAAPSPRRGWLARLFRAG